MKHVIFCHSLISDWNHGNAHFLRGVVVDLLRRGHHVDVFEPVNAWSVENLKRDHGARALLSFAEAYPGLSSKTYVPEDLDLARALDGADVVLMHEWNEPALIERVGRHRRDNPTYRLFFHDTHHRVVTAPSEMARFDLTHYDGVLAFGEILSHHYRARGVRAWTWHEAADVTRFRPRPDVAVERDLVWIGNWGDDERNAELREFLFEPTRELNLSARIHGVRYPSEARDTLARLGIEYAGWTPNFLVPEHFAAARVTVHVPRRPYVRALPGIPTIRVFEALACGIPLVSAPWSDEEGLFRRGDFLRADTGREMTTHLRTVLSDPAFATELARRGRETILAQHTCRHRVDELLDIISELNAGGSRRLRCAAN